MSLDIKIPFVTLLVLILTSFVPILHTSLLQIQGQILHYISLSSEFSSIKISIALNLTLGLVTLIAFLFSKHIGLKVLWSSLTAFFFMSSFYFSFEDPINSSQYTYYFKVMLISLFGTMPIIIAGLLKAVIK